MAADKDTFKVLTEGWFVEGEPRAHSEESFIEASVELATFIDGFVKKHGIEVIIGFVSPMADNPQRIYQGAIVLCHPDLAEVALNKLVEAVSHSVMVCRINQVQQN